MHVLTFRDRHVYRSDDAGITIPIKLATGAREVELFAKIDTGSKFCIFEHDYAECLGLTVECGIKQSISTVNSSFLAYGHDVSMYVLGEQYQGVAYFAVDPLIRRNVLGRVGWIQKIRLGIIDYDCELYVSHYDDGGARAQ